MIPTTDNKKRAIKILYFIGSLRSGGKERRLMELMSYLKNKGQYELEIVLTLDLIHFSEFYKLDIPCHIINKFWNKGDLTIFYGLYKICKAVQPDIIHTWGKVQTVYALPTAFLRKIPLVNSQITSAPPKNSLSSIVNLFDQLIFKFSTVVLANSQAGIDYFKPPKEKSKLIYNGLNINRFKGLPNKDLIKSKYNITTPYTVIMVATISSKKDYDLFFKVGLNIQKIRSDISFIGIGPYDEKDIKYLKIKEIIDKNSNLLFPGRIDEVEALVNVCDIGVLFTNIDVHGEGISNSIIEYMALAKPVIANNVGGNKEIIKNGYNGYLIDVPNVENISKLIIELIDNKEKSISFGKFSKKLIETSFTIDRMGNEFEGVYSSILPWVNNSFSAHKKIQDEGVIRL